MVAEALRRVRGRKLYGHCSKVYDHSKPFGPENPGVYDWQIEYHNKGADYPERALISANQVGKTHTAAIEVAMHMTGWYPEWWEGRRFDKPITVWTGCESHELSKDVVQFALMGPDDNHGTGWIPYDTIGTVTYRQAGVKQVMDTVTVKHVSGGLSACTFKTYHAGKGEPARKAWQGAKRDVIWLDEEAPQEVYSEALTRTINTQGIVLQTFTPLMGQTWIVSHFIGDSVAPGVWYKNVTWDDAPHMTPEVRKRVGASYQEHERDTRTKGVPLMGSGAVYPVYQEDIQIDPFEIPDHFYQIVGIDFGIDHPGAGVWLAIDRDADTVYVTDCYKKPGETPVYHAAELKKRGAWIPVSWPHDGMQRDKGSDRARPLWRAFREHGASMLPFSACYDDKIQGAQPVEPGVIDILERFRTGRLKIFSNLSPLFEEMRMYYRKDGQIVKANDHLLDAMRIGVMMLRKARHKPAPITHRRRYTAPVVGGLR